MPSSPAIFLYYLFPTLKRELRIQQTSNTLMEFCRCVVRQDLFAAVFEFMMNCVHQQSDVFVLGFRSFGTRHLLSGIDFRLYGLALQSQYSVVYSHPFNFVCSSLVELSLNFYQVIPVTISECPFKVPSGLATRR